MFDTSKRRLTLLLIFLVKCFKQATLHLKNSFCQHICITLWLTSARLSWPCERYRRRKKKWNQIGKPMNFGFFGEAFFSPWLWTRLKSDRRDEIKCHLQSCLDVIQTTFYLTDFTVIAKNGLFCLFFYTLTFQFPKLKLHHFRAKKFSFQ